MAFFNDNEGEIISIPFKGLNKLIQITLQICKKGIKNSGISSIHEKKKILKKIWRKLNPTQKMKKKL